MTNAPDTQTDKPNYKKTLNLPKTTFPMKANLVQNEPASLKRWDTLADKKGLYHAMQETAEGRPRFVFHDGPPYANGSIHLGHLMNKTLKDLVVRSKFMAGYHCPYVPGWDCHGLPIEHKVMTDLVESGKAAKLDGLTDDQRRTAVRRECKTYADKQIKLQAGQMKRLMTVADYEDPYLTFLPRYEAGVLEVLAGLCEQGLVYKALKPVHWSVANETALADAELEYQDREDLSVYVDFEAADSTAVYNAFGLAESEHPGATPSFMIWTTTPWTLPANLAIAVHEKFNYALVRIDGNLTVLAVDAVERVTKLAKSEEVETLATTTGDKLVGLAYSHPFIENAPAPIADPDADTSACYKVVHADYVTLEDGSGLVHTAPGHGSDDYITGLRVGLPVYCPVLGNGTYDTTAPDWLAGMSIWKANQLVADRLTESGHMFHAFKFMHSYPHDWRSKTPVIFRCTEQWFVAVDAPTKRDGHSLREMAMKSTGDDRSVKYVPAWGRNRMRGMLESRPDWCISRQRSWGLPIPAFTLPSGDAFMTAASVNAVNHLIREKGSDLWFSQDPATLLEHYNPAEDPDAPTVLKDGSVTFDQLTKGQDILDVWFESGSSWNAVMRQRSDNKDFPIDLYLEGSDQHRGWFQLSLLPSLGVMGRPPFRTLLTHGFMVDKDGKKLSKSAGAALKDLFDRYGVDVLRWWVCSLAYENDVKVDEEFFKVAGDNYRKIRNTLRFMLSNLDDYTPLCNAPEEPDFSGFHVHSIHAWVLGEYNTLIEKITEAYNTYAFHEAQKLIYRFCNTTLSSEYLSAVKDRLYCDAPDSERRRQTQQTLHTMTDGLAKLIAPVMCHTADEAYRALHKIDPKDKTSCVHLTGFPQKINLETATGWPKLWEAIERVMKTSEGTRAKSDIDNPLDLGVKLPDPDGTFEWFLTDDLADICGVSRFEFKKEGEIEITDLRNEPRCDRSWKRDTTVKPRSDGGMLSDRDAQAIGLA